MNSDTSHNMEMNLAWSLISQTSMSVFLTGKAGTGKTTFLKKLRELSPKRMVVLAPTGVAAINARGQTIHSFFQLPFGPIIPGDSQRQRQRKSYRMSQEKKNLIRTLDLLVIDEVSMVRCDLLDAIDAELRKYKDRYKPFGGVQLLLIGDLQQLPPVTVDKEWKLLSETYDSPYFFASKALQQTQYTVIELKRIYRQQDSAFIDILARIRENRLDSASVTALNARYIPAFVPPDGSDWIRLTTHNNMADSYNRRMLDRLVSAPCHYRAQIKGTFPETSYPADSDLELKVGAQVMFVRNDTSGAHAYYNGKIGTVTSMTDSCVCVRSKDDDADVKVIAEEWENTRYTIDNETKEIREEVEGTFKQFPLRLAWAITVHKSQGLTFDHAVLDINSSFAHGQTYVALSRCRTLEGLVLTSPLSPRAVITDSEVGRYIENALIDTDTVRQKLPELRREYFMSLLSEAFSYDRLAMDMAYLCRVADEHLHRKHPLLCEFLKQQQTLLLSEIVDVSKRFATQYNTLAGMAPDPEKDAHLQQRIAKAFKYFGERLRAIAEEIHSRRSVKIDNKQTAEQYRNAYSAFRDTVLQKTQVAGAMESVPFTVKSYLQAKAVSALASGAPSPSPARGRKKTIKNSGKINKQP